MTDRLTAYLAGPMRGIEAFNFRSFMDGARRLREAGYSVVSPAEHDLEQGFEPWLLSGDEDLSEVGFDLKEALRWDLEQVTKADAICVLPGWEKSSGARAEVAVAAAIGLRGGTLHDFLRAAEVEGYEIGLASDLLAACYSVQAEGEPYYYADEIDPPAEEDWDEGPEYEETLLDSWVGDPEDYEVRVTSSTGGEKGQKLAQYGLIPPRALRQVAEVYGYGATKYAPNNWRRGYDWRLSFDALMRHAWDFWNGEDADKESGLHPLAHAVFHCFSLIEYGAIHPEFDDRPTSRGVLT